MVRKKFLISHRFTPVRRVGRLVSPRSRDGYGKHDATTYAGSFRLVRAGQAEDSRETSQLGLTGGIVAQFDRRRDAEGWQEQLDTSRNLLTVALDEVVAPPRSPSRPAAPRPSACAPTI